MCIPRKAASSGVLKWLGLVTAIWVQSISGNNYTFSNYSDALKSLMNLTQVELNNLSVVKDVGKAFGLVAGFAADVLPTWVILLIGSVEGLIGYGGQWLVVSENVKPLTYWQMCILMCIGGNSTTWMNTAVLVTCIRNFRKNRGPVAGILKGYLGLSTAIFTDIGAALFNNAPSAFVALLAVVPFPVCVTAMLFLREIPLADAEVDENEDSQYFASVNTLAVVVAVYLLSYSFIPNPTRALSRGFSIILIILLVSPVSVPIFSYFRPSSNNDADSSTVVEPLIAITPEDEPSAPVDVGEEHTIWQALKKFDFWVLFASFLCGVGPGLAVQNNMGQIGLALGYTNVSIFVSLMSVCGFFGRIIFGTVSEYYIKKSGLPRPWWNAASQIVMVVGFVVMALGLPGCLYIGSVLVGACHGVRLPITVAAASELYGLKIIGMMYNILILNLPLGSFLFSGLLAGYLYDAQATPTEGGGDTCVGVHCYQLVFFIMAIVSFLGSLLDLFMVAITRQLYRKLHLSPSN